MPSKRIMRKSGQLSYCFVLLFLALTCILIAGCSKNCADYEKKLNAYADGSQPIEDENKVLDECNEAIAKCPNLAVPFEVMGDIDTKNKKLEEAGKNYDKALALNKNNKRVDVKKSVISEAAPETAPQETPEDEAKALAAKLESVKGMPLSEYVKLDESLRIKWCELSINDPRKYVFTGSRSTINPDFMKFSGSPQELDSLLVNNLEKNKSVPTADATALTITARAIK